METDNTQAVIQILAGPSEMKAAKPLMVGISRGGCERLAVLAGVEKDEDLTSLTTAVWDEVTDRGSPEMAELAGG